MRLRNRWKGWSVVKPMPARTCWQCAATVRAVRPADALARAAVIGPGSSTRPSRVASSASIATSASARRCRTAWNRAIGRPNCIRSTACVRASSSIGPAGAGDLVGDSRADRRRPPRPRPRRRASAASSPRARRGRVQAGVGVDPVDRGDLALTSGRRRAELRAVRGTRPPDRSRRRRAAVLNPTACAVPASRRPGRATRRTAGGATARSVRGSSPSASTNTSSSTVAAAFVAPSA